MNSKATLMCALGIFAVAATVLVARGGNGTESAPNHSTENVPSTSNPGMTPSLVDGGYIPGGNAQAGTSSNDTHAGLVAMATNYTPVYQGGEFSQFIGVGTAPPNANGPDYDHQFPVDTLWIKNQEFDPLLPGTEEYQLYFGASFVIDGFAWRCAGDFALLGQEDSGSFFERWIMISPPGARVAFRYIHAGSGIPPVLNPATHSIVGDGAYVPTGSRNFKATMRRVRLPHSLAERVTHFCVDPDGRYIFAVTEMNNIQRIDLIGTGITTLATASQLNLGVHDITSISVVATELFGRCLVMEAGLYRWGAYLRDQDNDGTFESVHVMPSRKAAYGAMTGDVVGRQDI